MQILAIQFKSLIDTFRNSISDSLFQQFEAIQAQLYDNDTHNQVNF